jgi:hypothetical protein
MFYGSRAYYVATLASTGCSGSIRSLMGRYLDLLCAIGGVLEADGIADLFNSFLGGALPRVGSSVGQKRIPSA